MWSSRSSARRAPRELEGWPPSAGGKAVGRHHGCSGPSRRNRRGQQGGQESPTARKGNTFQAGLDAGEGDRPSIQAGWSLVAVRRVELGHEAAAHIGEHQCDEAGEGPVLGPFATPAPGVTAG